MTYSLFHESANGALDEAIKACGGYKVVGGKLKPELSADAAGKWLNRCANSSAPERLDPDQLLFVCKEARRVGCHSLINYLLREAGYADAQPIEPEDERARLQREFINAVAVVQQLGKRLEAV